jgi:hypothetical protein
MTVRWKLTGVSGLGVVLYSSLCATLRLTLRPSAVKKQAKYDPGLYTNSSGEGSRNSPEKSFTSTCYFKKKVLIFK